MPKMVNIGCGSHFHKDWINIDLDPGSDEVMNYDIRKGLPFGDNSVDVVYSSHLLEHLTEAEGENFISEQWRILKNHGIIRVVVPDLEIICRNYLKYLEELNSGIMNNEFRYDYSKLEMYDQVTRTESGGELGRLWRKGNNIDLAFIEERHGKETVDYINSLRNNIKPKIQNGKKRVNILVRLLERMRKPGMFITEMVVKIFLGKKYLHYFREGIFRNRGEIHRTMYDGFSLKRILEKCGFSNVTICSARESMIENFAIYGLDVSNGFIRKPDSIYIEAVAKKEDY